jgi:kinesin family protein 6/9
VGRGQVDFNLPRDSLAGYVNNQREHYEYKFNGVIPPDAKQDEVG